MADTTVDRILWLVEAARKARVPVIWIKTHHDRWTNSWLWLTREMRNTGEGGDLRHRELGRRRPGGGQILLAFGAPLAAASRVE